MIIRIEPAKGGKLSLFSDGEYVMSVSPDLWYSLDYSDGAELSDEEFEKLKFEIDSRKAYAQALRFLTLRAHSADELYKKLIKKHIPECAEFAVEKCRELGFINDYDFAVTYANELAQKKKFGTSRIKNELFIKGIDREIIDSVINEIETDYSQSIIDIIEKKYYNCLSDDKGRQKMIAGLMRLGHSYSDIKSVLADYNLPEDGYYEP